MIALIKNIFFDVLYVYKNFLHWNISKLLIFLWSILLGFLAMIPFIFIIFIYGYFADLSIGDLSFQIITNNLGNDWIVNIFLYLTKFSFLLAYIYGYILLINLSLNYIDKKNIAYLGNYYFNISRIKKYLSITLYSILLLLIPVLLFLILIFLLVLIVGVEDSKNLIYLSSSEGNNFFTIISLILFLISAVLFIYILYRVSFSYFIFIKDSKNSQKAREYIKKSFVITKSCKSLGRFIVVLLIISPFAVGVKLVGGYLEYEVTTLNSYLDIRNFTPEQEEQFLETYSQYDYQSLLLKYSDVPEDELKSISTKNDIFFILFNILSFLFIYGVFIMILSSFYKRELLK